MNTSLQAGKMSRNLLVVIAILILVSACAPETQSTPIPIIDNATSTPSSIPTATQTSLPTETPTASITPLPTIPTFTPTFDVSTIVTVKPAPKAECPKEDRKLLLSVYLPTDLNQLPPRHEEIINSFQAFLNMGGEISSIVNELRKAKWIYEYQDVTGDTVPDLIIIDPEIVPTLRVFYCQNEQYELFTLIPTYEVLMDIYFTSFEAISDLNSNNLAEIIWMGGGCSNSGCFKVFTLEWNGHGFTDLSPMAEMFGVQNFEIKDVDKSLSLEFEAH